MVGAVLVGILTVSIKLEEADVFPSLTDTVMIHVPDSPAAGVTVIVRLTSLPPRTILSSGTMVVLEEAVCRVSFSIAVSSSPMVKLRLSVAWPVLMV